MKTLHRLLTGIALLLLTSPAVLSQQKPEAKNEPANKLVEFHMAILKRGPKWTAAETPETKRLQQEHVKYVLSTLDSGKAIIAGPFTDDGEIIGVFVFRVSSLEEAKALTATDPAVQAGRLAMELHQWMVPEGVLP